MYVRICLLIEGPFVALVSIILVISRGIAVGLFFALFVPLIGRPCSG